MFPAFISDSTTAAAFGATANKLSTGLSTEVVALCQRQSGLIFDVRSDVI
jgi:hypothetical protein